MYHPVILVFLFNWIEALTARTSHNSFPAEHACEKIVFITPDEKSYFGKDSDNQWFMMCDRN